MSFLMGKFPLYPLDQLMEPTLVISAQNMLVLIIILCSLYLE